LFTTKDTKNTKGKTRERITTNYTNDTNTPLILSIFCIFYCSKEPLGFFFVFFVNFVVNLW